MKILNKIRRYYREWTTSYPTEFRWYDKSFKLHDWTVLKETSYSTEIEIHFKEKNVAELVRKKSKTPDFSSDTLVIHPGYESLRPAIKKVLYAASRKKIEEHRKEMEERAKLVKLARSQVEFLG